MSIRSKLAVALLASLALAGWVLYAFLNRGSEVGGGAGGAPARPEPVIEALPRPGATPSGEARERPEPEPPENHHHATPGDLAAAIKVIDAESQEPIAGASVRLKPAPDPSSPPVEGGNRLPRSGNTDARGLFEARGLFAGRYVLSATAEGYLVSGGRKVLLPSQSEEELTVALTPGSAVAGSVLDPAGRAIQGAAIRPSVSADTVDESDESLSAALSQRAKSDAEGRYRLDGLPPRRDYVIEATHPDHAPASVKEVALGAGQSLEGVDLVLLRGGAISGRVVDEDGAGIAGASLWASPASAGDAEDAVRPPFAPSEPGGAPDAKTGADGSYRLLRLPAGVYTLEARDPKHERLPGKREQVEVAEGKTAEGVDIVLGPGESLSGRVVDTGGEPVESAEVIASGEVSSRAQSDAAGEFRITGLRAGKVHINVVKQGYDTLIDEAAVPAGDVVFTLVPRGAIRGIVRAPGQDAFPEFRIQVLCRLAEGEQASWVECRDPGGRFEVEGIAGVYVLRALVPGFAPSASAEIRLAARERKQGVVIDLQKGETVRGKVVVKGSGEPIEGAWISARAASASGWRTAPPGQSVRSGPDGSFAIEGVLEGEVDLEAHHRHYSRAEVKGLQVLSGKPAAVTIELGEGGRIRGSVRREDKLVSGVRIIGMRRGEVLAREAFTDSEGHFELKGLEEGDYSLKAMRAVASGGFRTVRAVELGVKEGEATEVELVDGARWKLRGRVSSGGAPVPGGSILAEQPESGESAGAEIDPSGSYSLELDGCGRYLLTIERSGRGRGGARVEVVLPDGAGELRRNLELPSGEVRGTVVDGGTGAALPDVQVWAVAEAASARSFLTLHGAARSTATTGASGRFVLSGLAPGASSLRAFAAGYADLRVDGVKVEERGSSGEVRLALERGMALEAKIVDAEGQPVSGAVAWLRTAGGDLAAVEPRASDDEGLVALSAPGEGGYRLTVLHASYAPSALPVEVKAGSAGATVALRRGGELRLRVVDRKGKPVEGAEVEVRNDRGENVVEDLVFLQALVTRIDGCWVLEHAAPGPYRVAARKLEARCREEGATVAEGQSTEVQLTVSR